MGPVLFRWIWSTGLGLVTPNPKKATARSLCIRPTTQLLHQGAGDAGRPKPEASLASATTNHRGQKLGAQGRGFESRSRGIFPSLFLLNLAIMIDSMCLFCAWWNLIIVIVREFTWLCVYCNLTSENILRKRDIYLKKKLIITLLVRYSHDDYRNGTPYFQYACLRQLWHTWSCISSARAQLNDQH